MPTPHPAETLLIEGPDAIAFAHAQFSSKVTSLEIGDWQFSAWLDPQGRVRALFHLARIDGDRLLLLLRGGNAASMVEALRRFVFRSKLTLTALPSRNLASGPAHPMHTIHSQAGTFSIGCGGHSLQFTDESCADEKWHLQQLRDGWPWLPARQLNELLPSALSLQRLQAVAIDKGCYPGQEIVARLHYRSGHKRHLHSVELSQPIVIGESFHRDGHEAGCVLDVIAIDERIEALVVLNDDVVTKAIDGSLNFPDTKLVMRVMASWPA